MRNGALFGEIHSAWIVALFDLLPSIFCMMLVDVSVLPDSVSRLRVPSFSTGTMVATGAMGVDKEENWATEERVWGDDPDDEEAPAEEAPAEEAEEEAGEEAEEDAGEEAEEEAGEEAEEEAGEEEEDDDDGAEEEDGDVRPASFRCCLAPLPH